MPVPASSARRASKFVAPPPPTSYVARPHLDARLNEAVRSRLTVVSGRAGCGKSALVASWMTTIDEPRSRLDHARRPTTTTRPRSGTTSRSRSAISASSASISSGGCRCSATRSSRSTTCRSSRREDGRNSLADLVALVPQWMHLIVMCRRAARALALAAPGRGRSGRDRRRRPAARASTRRARVVEMRADRRRRRGRAPRAHRRVDHRAQADDGGPPRVRGRRPTPSASSSSRRCSPRKPRTCSASCWRPRA